MELKFEQGGPSSDKAMRKKIDLSMMVTRFLREASKELSGKEMEDLINCQTIMFENLAVVIATSGYEFFEIAMDHLENVAKKALEEMNHETV